MNDDLKAQCLIERFPCLCALFARGPFLGRQEEHWAELVEEKAELQPTADDAGAGPVVKDIITLLQETNVCLHCTISSFFSCIGVVVLLFIIEI